MIENEKTRPLQPIPPTELPVELPAPMDRTLANVPTAKLEPLPLAIWEESTQRLKKPRKRRRILVRVLLIVLAVLLLLGSGTVAYAYYFLHTTLQKFIRVVPRGKDEPSLVSTPDDGTITGRSWNILLLGSDDDRKYTFPAVLTQVMMVIHIDPIHNTVSMVSIPRDSWVKVPELGAMHKIDQAFFLGAVQKNSFEDAVRLARLTVEKDYGIPIDRYAWVGLSGFASVIDTLGGVDVDLAHPLLDDNYPDDTQTNTQDPYALKRLYLVPGPQHLNGLQALEYVRSRHADLVGDIGRTERQQQVLAALKKKLDLGSIIGHLPALINNLTGKVYTDLSEREIIAFANYAHTLSGSFLQHVTLGPGSGDQNFGDLAVLYDPSAGANQDVVIPNCATIQPVINRIFGLGNAQSCQVT